MEIGNLLFKKRNSTTINNIYCLDIEGKPKWTKKMDSFTSIFNALGIFGNKICIGLMNRHFYCLDSENGRIDWSFDAWILVRGAIYDNVIYCGDLDNRLLALDFNTGKMKWMYLAQGPIACTPLVTENKIIFSCWDSYVYCINKEGKLIWKFKMEGEPSTINMTHEDEITLRNDQQLPEMTLPELYKKIGEGETTDHVYGSPMSGYVIKEKHYVNTRKKYV